MGSGLFPFTPLVRNRIQALEFSFKIPTFVVHFFETNSYMDITPKSFSYDYETTFILKPELPEGEHKAAVNKFVSLIKEHEGKITNIEYWGVRKLAYTIERKNSGFYAFLEFSALPETITKLEQEYRYDDNVLRYLTVKLTRHHLEFNKKRREQGFGLRKDAKVVNP